MSRTGGLPARRAVIRWAWRLFRREWRQQAAVLTLLTVAVTAAVVGVSAGYHAAPPATAAFGAAGQSFTWYADGEQPLESRLAQAREWFGTIDVIGHSRLPVPGSAAVVELRAQDPHGLYGAPMLRLLSGRYPSGPGEAAVTDQAATALRVRAGSALNLDGRTWTVVGLIENPGDLSAEFVLVPAQSEAPESVTVLTEADPASFARYRAKHDPPVSALRPAHQWVEAAAGVFSVFAVSMLLVCLIAAAGFAVVAHRRQRQLGLLAAVGATPRHLRLVLLAHGAAVGAAASAIGTLAGVLIWFAVTARFETAAGHRVERLDLPWWQLAAVVLLTVLAATAAAWRPARAASRVPITLALSLRPPRPKRVRRSAAAAAVLVVFGIVALRLAQRNLAADRDVLELADVVLIVGGTLAVGVALLFAAPLAIRLLATAAVRLPVAPRLALRDLARHQARSSAALAAISVALAVPAAIVIAASVLEQAAAGDGRDGLLALRTIATTGGAVLALVILATTVGLIRAEAAPDLRTLAATGATGGIRRTLTSATAGGLALLGAILGIAAAYTVILAGSSRSQLGELARVPVVELLVIAAGVPLVAAALGWLLAGREPRSLVRVRLE
ncbi:FtsX-like permease family protein [Actinoplanes sp. NBC_00393]|uniref:FtsX-like permease family protein n=1 Tax=Actinoplanes sp. NBC_00393 TaxID=2975953 RepID=UPI002E23104E